MKGLEYYCKYLPSRQCSSRYQDGCVAIAAIATTRVCRPVRHLSETVGDNSVRPAGTTSCGEWRRHRRQSEVITGFFGMKTWKLVCNILRSYFWTWVWTKIWTFFYQYTRCSLARVFAKINWLNVICL